MLKKGYVRLRSLSDNIEKIGLSGDDDTTLQLNHRQKARSRRYVITCALFISLYPILLGYDVGVMSGAILFIHEDLQITEVQAEVLIGCLSIVSLIGGVFGGKSSDAIGRKWTMGLGSIIFILGGIIMTVAPSFEMLMVGRLLSGAGIGFGATIIGVYIAEISPAATRGLLTSFPEIFINLGILIGYVFSYELSGLPSHINWRLMLGIGVLPSVILVFAFCFIPESPRWLVLQNRIEEARSVLMKTIGDEKEVEERLSEIQLASGTGGPKKAQEKAVWRELFRPTPMVARMLAVGMGIQFFQQITGIEALGYYSPTIFKDAGIEDNSKLLATTIGVGVTKTSFIVLALFLIDRVGRKPLLYISTIGMTISLVCLSVSLHFLSKGPLCIVLTTISVYGSVSFFSLGVGPICWVLNAEIFPTRLRAQAVSLGSVGNRISSGIVTLSFLSVAKAITVAGTFSIFSALSLLSIAFIYFVVPETKGKTLEEIESLFKDRQLWSPEELELEPGDSALLVPKD